MGRKHKQKSDSQQLIEVSKNELNPLDTDDLRTIQKRKEVREKLKRICEPQDNIDEILSSLESYCLLILHSLK